MEQNTTEQSQVEESSQSKKLVAGDSKTPNEQMINEATNISDQASGDLETTRGLQIDDKQNDQENERRNALTEAADTGICPADPKEQTTRQNAPTESDDMETSPGNTKQQMAGDPSSGDIEKTGGQPIDEKQNDKKKERGKTSEESEKPTDLSTDDKQTGRLIEQNNTLTEENTVKDKQKRNQKMRLKEQKEALCKENQKLKEQNETLKEEKKMLKDENTRLTSDIERLTDENTCLSSDIERIKTRCLSVSQQYGAKMNAEECISYLHNENRRLTESLQEMTTERDNLQKRSETVQESANKLNKDFENLKKDLEEKVEKCSHLSSNVTKYKNQLSRKEEEWKSVKSALNSENKDLKGQLKKMKSSHEEELKVFRVSRDNEIKQRENSYKILREEVTQQKKLMHNREQEAQRLKDAYETKIKQLTSEVNMMKPSYEYYPQLVRENRRLDIQLKNSEETIQTIRQETLELEKEKQNLLLRLSKLAGANLTYNNPNIADLSDEKRPTKLAEEFSELYDNEWTDAFEEVDISDEKTKTTFMLELLQLAYQLCHHVSTEHSQNIQRSLSTLTVSMVDTAPPAEQKSNESSEDTTRNNEAEGKGKADTIAGDKELLDSMPDLETDNSQENGNQSIVAGKDEKPDSKINGLTKDKISEPKKGHDEFEPETDVKGPNQNFKSPDGEKDKDNLNRDKSHSEYKNDEDTKDNGKTVGTTVVSIMDENDITSENKNLEISKGETYEEHTASESRKQIKASATVENDKEADGSKDHETEIGKAYGPLNPDNGTVTGIQTSLGVEHEKSQGARDVKTTTDENEKARRSHMEETVRHSGDQQEDNLNVPSENQQPVSKNDSFEDAKANHNCDASVPNGSTNTSEEDAEAKQRETEKNAEGNQVSGESDINTTTSITTEEDDAEPAETVNDAEDNQNSAESIRNTAIGTIEEDEARKEKKEKLDLETENGSKIDGENNQIRGGSDINTSFSTTKGDEAEPVEKDGEDNRNRGESILDATNGTTEDNDTKNGEEAKPVETEIERTLTANMETLKVRNEQKKAVQDIQKLVEKTLSNELQEVGAELIAIHKGIDCKKDVTVTSYIRKCINVCWSMCLQEPPVHVDIGDVTGESPFDTNKYKPYTKSGKYLDFIVWPALYLHKGGPMLSKGVAQGRK